MGKGSTHTASSCMCAGIWLEQGARPAKLEEGDRDTNEEECWGREDGQFPAHLPHRLRSTAKENGSSWPAWDNQCKWVMILHSFFFFGWFRLGSVDESGQMPFCPSQSKVRKIHLFLLKHFDILLFWWFQLVVMCYWVGMAIRRISSKGACRIKVAILDFGSSKPHNDRC